MKALFSKSPKYNNHNMINRTHTFSLFAAGIAGIGAQTAIAAGLATHADSHRPNILIILVDDLGYGDLSCQYAKDIQTPNIDKLFAEGLTMTRCYANSNVSSPSRAGLLTGCYPQLVGVPGVIRTNPKMNWGYLDPQAILLPSMLKQAGYHTAAIGKWHLGLESPNLPNDRGFDRFEGFLGDAMDNYYTHMRQGQNYMRQDSITITPKGHATDLFTDWAITYCEKQSVDSSPFFLYLAYNAPHSPIQPPKAWEERVLERERNIAPKRAKLVALIEHLDYNIGRVIEALERTGQRDNTLIVFASDNGGPQGVLATNGPLRGYKGDMYDGGTHVPCCINWRGKIASNRCDRLMMLSDLFPTFCDLVSVPIRHRIDGISLLPTLRGQEQITDNRYLFWMRREHGDFGGQSQFAVLYKGIKLLQNRPFQSLEMYDLNTDPAETSALPLEGDVYKQLYKQMTEHYRQSGAIPWQKRSTNR